jgi:cystathionine beta-lyase family protein involved in aluminum resistance
MNTESMYTALGITPAVHRFGEEVLAGLRARFDEIDRVAEYNQCKVIGAMQKNRVDATHFAATTGYGYNDAGRDNLERVYADCFHTEAALVRPQITCGTHALTVALSANLLPGDTLLSPVGAPYDTLEEVIGIRPSACSLKEYGVHYRQVDLLPDYGFDYPAIEQALRGGVKLVTIQRSKGYATRPTFSVQQIGELIAFCKRIDPNVICMVDNCYGEFVETIEPSDLGADMIVGSLIKNPGGGLAPIGGYICGRKDVVDRCAYRLSAPGLGQEVGANLGLMPAFYQGFFLAPTVTAGSRARCSRRMSTSGWAFAASRTRRSRGTTSSSAWSSARRSAWSPSARASRRPRPWTAMSTPSPGPCRATIRRSSWPPVRSCRARPSSCRPTGRSARPTPCIFRAA